MEWKLEKWICKQRQFSRGSEFLMAWTRWSQIWSTKSRLTTNRRPLKRRRNYLRWRRKYLLLQADPRLKQNHEDLPLVAHLQELYLFVKEDGTILNRNSIEYRVPSGKTTDYSSSSWSITVWRRSGDWILEIKRLSSERFWELSALVWRRARWQEAEVKRTGFNIVLIHQDKNFFISELFKVIQDAIPWILHCRTVC